MTVKEIVDDIATHKNNQLAQAFTMVICGLLKSKGIHPILKETCKEFDEENDINKHILSVAYDVGFDIDTSEHDKQIRADAETEGITRVLDILEEIDSNILEKVKDRLYEQDYQEHLK